MFELPLYSEVAERKHEGKIMAAYIRLNKSLDNSQVLGIIKKEIEQYGKNNNLSDSILCIELKSVGAYVENIVEKKLLEAKEGQDDRRNDMPEPAQDDN